MATYRHLLLCLSFLTALVNYALASHSFENTAIVRTIELAGSLIHLKTTFAARALETGTLIYTFALGKEDGERTSFMEARFRGEDTPLEIQKFGFNAQTNTYPFAVMLPKGLKKDEVITLELETVQTHATYAWPQSVGQNDDMYLKYETDLFVISPYPTHVQRTKIRAPSPNIKSFTQPEGLDAFTLDAPATKSGATITYGPYNNIPASASNDFRTSTQKRITVHFKHDLPKMTIPKLKRAAEISHWGANLNIQDDIWLHNDGPDLKGHFSRLEHQQQAYYQRPAGHIMRAVSLHLPPGAHDVYYTDIVGNVSTSALRPVPSVPKGVKAAQSTVLELRPRYPLLGGWNYTFSVGWDMPLWDWAAYDKSTGRYIAEIPIMTDFPDTVIEDAELQVIFPEGATDLEVYPPFAPKTVKQSLHKTYLDSAGRPTISFVYGNLTDRHEGFVYVAYKVPFSMHLRKPFAVGVAFLVFFVVGGIARRLDWKIRDKKY